MGTASGQFLRPAASRLLLSRFLPNSTGPSHKAPARLGSSGLSLLGAPGKWGKKKENIHVLPQLSDDHRLRRRRPGAASSAEQQRLEVHRSFRRDAAVVEEHRRRMGVEDRVASRLRYMEFAKMAILGSRPHKHNSKARPLWFSVGNSRSRLKN